MADYQSFKKIDASDAFINGTVGPTKVSGVSTGIVCRMFYFNCCHNIPCNGGCCYLWTVPNGVTTIQFEIVSGGGSGSGARCCGNGPGYGGGGGGYATKMQYANCGHFTAGSTQYTICAGSTSRCSCCGCCHGRTGCGFYGCPSFVLGGGLGTFCMQGGSYSTHRCTNSCYSCLKIAQRTNCFNACSAAWPDARTKPDSQNPENEFYICGLSGGELKHVDCHSFSWSVSSGPVGPWQQGGNFGVSRCSTARVRGCCSAPSLFPGGGGHNANTCDGNQCWGDWGGGGLVVVTTWS